MQNYKLYERSQRLSRMVSIVQSLLYPTRTKMQMLNCLREKSMREFGIPGKHFLNDLRQVMDVIQNEPSLPISIRCNCCGFLCEIGIERLFAVEFRHQRNFPIPVLHDLHRLIKRREARVLRRSAYREPSACVLPAIPA